MVGVFVIPINELQAKIYQALKELDIDVYDEVVEEAKMPLIAIGDYNFSAMDYKGDGFSFNWTLDIYTDYEGKKQVNELVSKAIECMQKINGTNLGDNYLIDDVMPNEASVNRNEGYYVANLNMKIDIIQEV